MRQLETPHQPAKDGECSTGRWCSLDSAPLMRLSPLSCYSRFVLDHECRLAHLLSPELPSETEIGYRVRRESQSHGRISLPPANTGRARVHEQADEDRHRIPITN